MIQISLVAVKALMHLDAAQAWLRLPEFPRFPSARNGWRRDLFAGARMSDERLSVRDGTAMQSIAAIAMHRDQAAFAALFDEYAPRIKTFLMRRGATADTAEDVAQDVMITVWRKAASFDPMRASVSTWIFTIARNHRIDGLRREQRASHHDSHDLTAAQDVDEPDSILEGAERDGRVRDALGHLSREQGRVVQLSFFDGKAHAEIAQALDIPLGTVKSRLRLAMEKLRGLLGDLT